MNTKELIFRTQTGLTKAMMIRSVPSGGLPLAFRSLLLELSNRTILKGDAFKTCAAASVVGGVVDNYYKAGDMTLEKDIASMSDEPFPLITPYRKQSVSDEDRSTMKVSTFKNHMTGGNTSLRYMMVQFSALGYEYMKNVKYFPKILNINNDTEVALHIKSHVPAELFRTTVFRTQGRGADTYPLNPSEVFYTMYELLEYGFDTPVENLTRFRGFDLGNPNISVIMKPEALSNLFEIGICSFKSKVSYDVSLEERSFTIKAFPYDRYGNVYDKLLENKLRDLKFNLGSFTVDPGGQASHIGTNLAVKFSNCRFHTHDLQRITKDIESHLKKELYANHYHYSHQLDVTISDEGLEKDYVLESKSVRQIMIECIKNFFDITKVKYQTEIEEIEERLKDLRIFEKATRPHIAEEIHKFLRNSNRENQLFATLKKLTEEDSEKTPEFTLQEIKDYIYVRKGNEILPNLDIEGHYSFKRRIQDSLDRIKYLKDQMKDENIVREAKETYLNLSKHESFTRKSPVYFLNGALSVENRERLLDYVNNVNSLDLSSKIHFYGGNSICKTSGNNISPKFMPTYTLKEYEEYLVQEGNHMYHAYPKGLPSLGSKYGVKSGDIKIIHPSETNCLYMTNLGRLGFTDKVVHDGASPYMFMKGELTTDMIKIPSFSDRQVNKLKVLISSEDKITYLPLRELINQYKSLNPNEFNEMYGGTLAIETFEEVDDLNYIYMWHGESGFISLGTLKFEGNEFPFRDGYFKGKFYSGNLKYYIDGIHVPVDVINSFTDIQFKKNKSISYIEVPKEMYGYIVNISDKIEDVKDSDLEQIKGLVANKIDSIRTVQSLPKKAKGINILAFNPIREI